ncbi:MCE family protein [Haloechinothrix sp. YIM 98757]|uniref:MCE family protein n=1 Tax=Haloechinothrix aidingensis TaxID=2752311 RepID=A0A838ABY3_9PSEU|nr:MlaD family protein [Haloechinothrix aidingensis]MBA0126772.1 MCE family protein [Haloechinothrix aidingensis]
MMKIGSLKAGALSVRRDGRRAGLALGLALLAALMFVLLMLYFKPSIQTFLRSGETITMELERDYQLHADENRVYVAGLEAGVVSDVEHVNDETVRVAMKVDEDVISSLGSKPSAEVRPNTVLGGAYVVELKRGGGTGRFEDGFIPRERTQVPVELDRVLESLPGPTRESLQDTVGQFDDTLAAGGKEALRDIVANAPETLDPAGTVLEAAQGTRPGIDLPQIVTNFHSIADVLSRNQGQLGDVVQSLRDTTTVLANQSRPLADGIESMPATLRDTRSGMVDLRGTLDELTVTAESFRPAARELEPLLRRLDPVLRKARPLMEDLRPLLEDARPVVDELVPVAQRGTGVLDDFSGPVLERVNGPVTETVMNTWRGSGPYENSGGGVQADNKFYEELGFLTANMARAAMTQDRHGALIGFQVGANSRSVVGTPFTLPNLLDEIEKYSGGTQ